MLAQTLTERDIAQRASDEEPRPGQFFTGGPSSKPDEGDRGKEAVHVDLRSLYGLDRSTIHVFDETSSTFGTAPGVGIKGLRDMWKRYVSKVFLSIIF